MAAPILINLSIGLLVVVALSSLLWVLAREFKGHQKRARISDIVDALSGLYGVHGDLREPLWPQARVAITRAVQEVLGLSQGEVVVCPKCHRGGPQICGAIVYLRRGARSVTRSVTRSVLVDFECEVRRALPDWASFKLEEES